MYFHAQDGIGDFLLVGLAGGTVAVLLADGLARHVSADILPPVAAQSFAAEVVPGDAENDGVAVDFDPLLGEDVAECGRVEVGADDVASAVY